MKTVPNPEYLLGLVARLRAENKRLREALTVILMQEGKLNELSRQVIRAALEGEADG